MTIRAQLITPTYRRRGRMARRLVTWLCICLAAKAGLVETRVSAQAPQSNANRAAQNGMQPINSMPPIRPGYVANPQNTDSGVKPDDIKLPVPKPLTPPPFGTAPMPRSTVPVIGGTPKADPAIQKKYAEYFGQMIDAEATMDLNVGKTRLLVLKAVPKRIQLADDSICEYNLISTNQISLMGKNIGVTVLTMWFDNPAAAGGQDILTYHVRVLPDPEARRRLEASLCKLADEINCTFPDSVIKLHIVGDKIVVSGHAKDSTEVAQILRIVKANSSAPLAGIGDGARLPLDPGARVVAANGEPVADGRLAAGWDSYIVAGMPWVVNLIKVPGEQQVCLRVTVAEVNRAAARSIGLNFTVINNSGATVFANNTGNIAAGGLALNNAFGGGGGAGGAAIAAAPGFARGAGGYANIQAALDNGQVNLAISALRTLNYARMLAEPNLVTLNGQPANFQAGGQFPVPIIGGSGNAGFGLQGVNFVPYGVSLSFTPYITDRDRVRLYLSGEISGRDLAAGVSNIGGTAIPYLNTRSFQTTVEMREGQTIAIAGLIQNNIAGDSRRIPFFGDLPIIGRFASFDRVQAGEQELVVMITPELVHPLDCKERPPLPGADLFEPNDCEFYLLGRLESHRPYDYRSPIMTDWQRIRQYKQMEKDFIVGPSGHCE